VDVSKATKSRFSGKIVMIFDACVRGKKGVLQVRTLSYFFYLVRDIRAEAIRSMAMKWTKCVGGAVIVE